MIFSKIKMYLIGGAALLALSFVSYLLWQLNSLSSDLAASQAAEKQATGERDRAIEANKLNTQALQTLAWYRAMDSAKVEQLATELQSINDKYQKSLSDREKLKKENPDVKTFLELDIPPALRRVQPKR